MAEGDAYADEIAAVNDWQAFSECDGEGAREDGAVAKGGLRA
jgi:hypothetical protein